MLHFKRRQSKSKKRQNAQRAYIEQLAFIRQFRKDEDGGLIVLTLLMLVSMLVVGGMAVDFMRFEAERTKLQSVSDRAVLSAANLNQERDASAVLTEFFEAEGYAGTIVGTPVAVKNENGSMVSLSSRIDVDTFFLRLIGMDTLSAPASATAMEGVGNVEISLVLDISGSMAEPMTGQIFGYDGGYDADGNPIGELIRDLQERLEITSVVVTHEMELCFAVSDRVALLRDGVVAVEGTAEEMRRSEHPKVRAFIEGSFDPAPGVPGLSYWICTSST